MAGQNSQKKNKFASQILEIDSIKVSKHIPKSKVTFNYVSNDLKISRQKTVEEEGNYDPIIANEHVKNNHLRKLLQEMNQQLDVQMEKKSQTVKWEPKAIIPVEKRLEVFKKEEENNIQILGILQRDLVNIGAKIDQLSSYDNLKQLDQEMVQIKQKIQEVKKDTDLMRKVNGKQGKNIVVIEMDYAFPKEVTNTRNLEATLKETQIKNDSIQKQIDWNVDALQKLQKNDDGVLTQKITDKTTEGNKINALAQDLSVLQRHDKIQLQVIQQQKTKSILDESIAVNHRTLKQEIDKKIAYVNMMEEQTSIYQLEIFQLRQNLEKVCSLALTQGFLVKTVLKISDQLNLTSSQDELLKNSQLTYKPKTEGEISFISGVKQRTQDRIQDEDKQTSMIQADVQEEQQPLKPLSTQILEPAQEPIEIHTQDKPYKVVEDDHNQQNNEQKTTEENHKSLQNEEEYFEDVEEEDVPVSVKNVSEKFKDDNEIENDTELQNKLDKKTELQSVIKHKIHSGQQQYLDLEPIEARKQQKHFSNQENQTNIQQIHTVEIQGKKIQVDQGTHQQHQDGIHKKQNSITQDKSPDHIKRIKQNQQLNKSQKLICVAKHIDYDRSVSLDGQNLELSKLKEMVSQHLDLKNQKKLQKVEDSNHKQKQSNYQDQHVKEKLAQTDQESLIEHHPNHSSQKVQSLQQKDGNKNEPNTQPQQKKQSNIPKKSSEQSNQVDEFEHFEDLDRDHQKSKDLIVKNKTTSKDKQNNVKSSDHKNSFKDDDFDAIDELI